MPFPPFYVIITMVDFYRYLFTEGEIIMKKKVVVLGLVGAMALGTCTVSAANGTRNISATFRNIKIVVDGKQVSTSAEPFIYNGTTYLPIRAVGEAVGKEVTWNAGTNTVYLGEVPASAQQQPAPAPVSNGAVPQEIYDAIGISGDELAEYVAVVRSGDESAFLLAEIYAAMVDYASAANPQLLPTIYAEAQQMFATATNNPDYSDAKTEFEEIYQKYTNQ